MPGSSTVRREVKVILPLPYFSAASLRQRICARSEHAVFCDDASGEFLSSPVEQEALSFYTLDILFLKCHVQYPFFIFVFSITMLLYFLRFYW